MDFMTDSLVDGGHFRLLNVIDDYNRESLWIEMDTFYQALELLEYWI
ncbi:hypothetical protein CLV59_104202 [Chitinophaga dinghuensis]|uniref:Integrase-like protein n=1 Tax=Chitinophaga dinghuensis TaxID=1539050 RepID=A0A327VYA1_9BACT|nr:hypothetical protein CLV59_104202 [Chitinophaga dinghuensis]